MSNTDEELTRNVQSTRDDLDVLVRIVNEDEDDATAIIALFTDHGYELETETDPDTGDLEFDKSDAADTARTILEEMPLEIVVHGTKSLGDEEWSITGLRVVFGTGGPHIELDTQTGDVNGYWGGARARATVATDTQAYFEQLADL